tara:strand:- start:1591 stop:1821 length:231 start_codon:yes stop_codon:yes gene_type:complete
VTLSRWIDWIGEDDPVSHSPLRKDYAWQKNLQGFLIKNDPYKNGLHKGSPKFREENCYSLLLMGILGSILLDVCPE